MIHSNFRSRPQNDAGFEREAKTSNERTERKKQKGKKTEERDLGKVGSKKVVAHFTIFYYKKRKISLFPIMTQGSHLEGEREREKSGREEECDTGGDAIPIRRKCLSYFLSLPALLSSRDSNRRANPLHVMVTVTGSHRMESGVRMLSF